MVQNNPPPLLVLAVPTIIFLNSQSALGQVIDLWELALSICAIIFLAVSVDPTDHLSLKVTKTPTKTAISYFC